MKKPLSASLSRREALVGAASLGLVGLGSGCAPRSVPVAAGASTAAMVLAEPLSIDQIETPALLLDLDAFERNLEKMARHARRRGIGLRPHAKTHKSPIIARRQIELGAVGICCAKVSEAEVMVDGGIEEVLITSPVSTADKIERVVALARRAPGLMIVIDNPGIAAAFGQAAKAAGIVLPVLIALDTGTRRTGVPLGEPAVRLAEAIASTASLDLRGLQAYAGHVMHVPGHAARAERSRETLDRCLETKRLLEEAGHEIGIFTGGGTGTFDIDCDVEGMTDLQVGSYCFMDVQYRAIGDGDSEVFDYFEPSLFVLTTAISQPVPELITVDAGYKAFANEPDAKPVFRDLEGMIYHYGGDEHGIVQFVTDERPLVLGQKTPLVVSHCDPTVNLYDVYYPYRDGRVTEMWPVAARGRSQ